MNGQCQAIEFLYRNGKTASEIFRLLKPKVSRFGVFKIIKRFKETGSFLPRVRNTPPRPIRTPTLIKIIKNKIKKNPKRTVRRLALEANVSRMTIHNILKKDLKLYLYKMVNPNVETLKQSLEKCWDEIPEETLQATCAQVIQRLRRVIARKGSFIEF